MPAEWKQLSKRDGLRATDSSIEVTFADQRRQLIHIDAETTGSIRLWTVIATRSIVRTLKNPLLLAWQRNRLSEFVGFTIDRHGRLIGESWVPSETLSTDEWDFQVRAVAEVCDRMEYLVTGADVS